MNQKTLLSLVAFAALGLGAFFAMRAPEKGEQVGPRQPPKGVVTLKDAQIDELEITNAKVKTSLKKEDGHWMVTAPVHYLADAEGVKSALEKLGEVSWGAVVSDQPPKAKEMEVDDEKGTRVVAKQQGRLLADVYFGKSVSGYTMARPNGSNEIWQTSGLTKWVIGKDTKGWRDKRVTDVPHDSIETITVDAGDKGKLVFKRIAADKTKNTPEKFDVVESTVKIDKLDEQVPMQLASTIAGLHASDFADDAKPDDTGLAKPDYKITVKAGAQTATILIGKQKGEDYYVKNDTAPQVFLLPKYSAERLAKAPNEFRDKTVIDVKGDDVTGLDLSVGGSEIMLEKSGADWKAKKGGITPDVAKITPIVQGLAGFKAASFADPAVAKVQLAKPAGRLTVHTKDKKTVTLTFGALKGDDYPTQVSGRPDVYMVKKFMAERFLKKADDLKKPDTTAKKS
jgi:hypothetical protein